MGKYKYERTVKSQLSHYETIVVSLASILDGLLGVVTLGYRMGTHRQRASSWGDRRLASRQWWL